MCKYVDGTRYDVPMPNITVELLRGRSLDQRGSSFLGGCADSAQGFCRLSADHAVSAGQAFNQAIRSHFG